MRRCSFSHVWVQRTQATAVVCLALASAAARAKGAAGAGDAGDDLAPAARFWEPSVTLGAGGGYKDNVALSHAAPERSAFFRSSLEGALTRLPLDGTQVTVFLTGEDTRYFSSETVDHEDVALAQAEVRRFIGNHWQAALAADGSYIHQVIDLSVTETNRTPVLVRGGGVTLRPAVRYDWAGHWWTALEAPASRQSYDETIDDYWQAGTRVTLGRSYQRKSEVALTYDFAHRQYDEDPARTSDGAAIAGQVRASDQHDIAVAWKHFWDESRRWRTTTRVGFRHNTDNAGGYFDYTAIIAAEQLRFASGRWQVTAEARLARYDYPVQTIGGPDDEKRNRADLLLNVRAEFQLARYARLYAQYEREQTFSNQVLDEYAVNTYSGGVLVEF